MIGNLDDMLKRLKENLNAYDNENSSTAVPENDGTDGGEYDDIIDALNSVIGNDGMALDVDNAAGNAENDKEDGELEEPQDTEGAEDAEELEELQYAEDTEDAEELEEFEKPQDAEDFGYAEELDGIDDVENENVGAEDTDDGVPWDDAPEITYEADASDSATENSDGEEERTAPDLDSEEYEQMEFDISVANEETRCAEEPSAEENEPSASEAEDTLTAPSFVKDEEETPFMPSAADNEEKTPLASSAVEDEEDEEKETEPSKPQPLHSFGIASATPVKPMANEKRSDAGAPSYSFGFATKNADDMDIEDLLAKRARAQRVSAARNAETARPAPVRSRTVEISSVGQNAEKKSPLQTEEQTGNEVQKPRFTDYITPMYETAPTSIPMRKTVTVADKSSESAFSKKDPLFDKILKENMGDDTLGDFPRYVRKPTVNEAPSDDIKDANTSNDNLAMEDAPLGEALSENNDSASEKGLVLPIASGEPEIEFGMDIPVREISPDEIIISDMPEETEPKNEEPSVEGEYTSNSQNNEIMEAYASRRASVVIRLCTVAIFTIILLFIENVAFFGVDIVTLFGSGATPRTLALADALLVALSALLAGREIISSFSGIRSYRLNTSFFASLAVIACALSSLLIAAFTKNVAPMYGMCAAFAVCLLLLGAFFDIESQMEAFSVVSSSGDKLVCEISATTDKEFETMTAEETVRIKKTGFVLDFFKSSRKRLPPTRTNFVLACLSVAIALALSIIAPLAFGGGFVGAVSVFALSLSMALPSFVLCTRIYSVYCISRRAREAGSAIVGDCAVDAYSKVDSMLFEDVEAFPSSLTKVVKIKLVSDCALPEALYYVASLFRHVGGPLETVFGVASVELEASDRVTLQGALDDGLCATVDNVAVCVGSHRYMESLGVDVAYDSEDERRIQAGPISIMYLSLDGKYCGKFYIQYAFDRNFARRVVELKRAGITTCIRTFDPNINDEIIKKTTRLIPFGIKVVKKTDGEVMDFGAREMPSTLLTKYTSAQLIKTILLCKRASIISRFAAIGKILTLTIGTAAVAAGALFGIVGSIYSIYPVLYHAFFALLYSLVAKLYLK